MQRLPCWLAVLAAIGIAGCAFPGQRVLHLEIYQGEQLVLRTMFSAPDREGPRDFWRRAAAEPFAAEDPVARVQADEGHPLRATLTGPVRLEIRHVDRPLTGVSLTNLVLRRSTSASPKWHLAPEETERARRAAGL
jgi:hypothetical protein